jgi:Tissue inhibitor of metalloproteinase
MIIAQILELRQTTHRVPVCTHVRMQHAPARPRDLTVCACMCSATGTIYNRIWWLWSAIYRVIDPFTKSTILQIDTQQHNHAKMKSVAALVGILLSLPAITVACRCIAIDFESALSLTDAAFRGTVVRKLKNANGNKVYEVRVNRLFKGCNFEQSNHIIVTTRTQSAACGIDLTVNESYAFTGYRSTMSKGIKNQLGSNRKKISSVFGATLCDFITKWADVTPANLELLRGYDNSDCTAQCDVDGDCPKGASECGEDGTCQPIE